MLDRETVVRVARLALSGLSPDEILAKLDPQPQPVAEHWDPARALPKVATRTAYERAVAKTCGVEAILTPPEGFTDRPNRSGEYWRAAHPARPYGGSWLEVKGQPRSNLLRRHTREHNRWLKQLDRQCRDNPSPSFHFRRAKDPITKVDDVELKLQLLGVTLNGDGGAA